MPNFTQGSMRVVLQQPDLSNQNNGSIVLDSRRTRPLWFDGRFLAAKDLEREQDYFLQRQADLGQAGGFGVMHGLFVSQPPATGEVSNAETIVIQAGDGITPAGELVMLPNDLTIQLSDLTEEENLGLQFGISTQPQQPARTRTGIYVIALRPVEFTANPITSYPTSIQGSRTTHDGDIVEATAVSLVPYPNPINTSDPSQQQAVLARQIFVAGNPGTLSDSLLPLAMISLQRGHISWVDPYLVRRDSGPQYSGVRFGLTDPSAQQAYLMQYNAQLQAVVATRQSSGLVANFAATDFFKALPSAGPFPLDGISTRDFSQLFFPPQMDVRLSIIPSDELPALVADSLSLPPIDLTLPASAYANLAVFALIPVPRNMLASLQNSLPDTPLNPTLPQVIANRTPLQLLRLFQGNVTFTPPLPVANSAWATAIGQQKYGFYVRRRSEAIYVDFTSVGLSSSQNPAAFGNAVTFTATVRPSTATGTIQFNDGVTPLGSPVTLVGASASLTVPDSTLSALSVGPHPITAVYSGDDEDAGSTSSTLNELVSDAIVVVSSSVDPSTLGQAVTFTATVTPNTATGNIQFSDAAATMGPSIPLSGASATLTVPSASVSTVLSVGSHAITAAYSGDANNVGTTSAAETQTVNQAESSVTVTSSLNPAPVGQSVSFTATVTGSVAGIPATGTVTFKNLLTAPTTASPTVLPVAIQLGTAPVKNGLAVLAVSTLQVGTNTITAVYNGDANYLPSSASTPVVETITSLPSGVVLSSSPNPSTFQQSVSLTATVTPSTATGTVQFIDGTTNLSTPVTIASGQAELAVATLSVGTHSITAAYSGNATEAKSTSNILTQTVNPLGATVTLSSGENPSAFGDNVTFTATVTPNTATGNMQFLDGTTPLSGMVAISGGKWTFAVSTLAVGTHQITAAYQGDTNDAPGKSAALAQVVNQIATTATVSSSGSPSTPGQSVKFTANVLPAAAGGTVTFLDGSTVIGTGSLSGGTTSFATASLSLGTHSITVKYGGDTNHAPCTSPAITQEVALAQSVVTLVSSTNPAPFGASVTFTATVPSGATGSVQFMDGANKIGVAVSIVSGKAATSANTLTVGSHAITAAYGGDSTSAGSTSNTVTQVISQANSSVTVTSSAASAPFGQPVTFTAAVLPGSATGSVKFMEGTATLGTEAVGTPLQDSTLAVGTHSITGVYSGDTNFSTSTSPAVTQTITQRPTSTSVISTLNPTIVNKPATFIATVSPNTAGGSVAFKDGATTLGSATLAGGSASFTAASLTTAGAHSITAVYSGDTNDATSTSAPLIQNVSKEPSTVTVSSKASSSIGLAPTPNVSTFGESVFFTATVSPFTAGETVTFTAGSTTLGSAVLDATGNAALTVLGTSPALTAGTHAITATYVGDATIAAGSGSMTQTVNKASTTITVAPVPPSTTTSALPPAFVATVVPSTATGNVTFTATSGVASGPPPIVSSPLALTAGVSAHWAPTLPPSLEKITATYNGDANFLSSTSPSINFGG